MPKTTGIALMRAQLPKSASMYAGFGGDELIKRFYPGFDADAYYTFLRTTPTLEVASAIQSQPRGQARAVDPMRHVLERYYEALHFLFRHSHGRFFEKGNLQTGLLSYPVVELSGEAYRSIHPDYPSWPTTHVVKDSTPDSREAARFVETVGMLGSEEVFRLIKEQGQEHYHIHIFKHVFENGIMPLSVDEETWKISGQTLKTVIEFLGQYRYSLEYPNDGCHCSDD